MMIARGLSTLAHGRRFSLSEADDVQQTFAALVRAVELVDELLQKRWNRTSGVVEEDVEPKVQELIQATCSCGSGIPLQDMVVNGKTVTLIALPLIFQQFRDSGKPASQEIIRELLETVKVYNPIRPDEEEAYAAALLREYDIFFEKPGAVK
jgi:hypothetical protein